MYNDKLVCKVVIWVFCGISLWKEKEALTRTLQGVGIYYREGQDAGENTFCGLKMDVEVVSVWRKGVFLNIPFSCVK